MRAACAAAGLAAAMAGCGAPDAGPPQAAAVEPSAPGFVDPAEERAVLARLAAPRAAKASPLADAGAITRPGLYATESQAARALAARPGGALRVKVEPGGHDEVELCANLVWGELIAAGLPLDTPVFVAGRDARLAAVVVDRLAADGLTRVFLVGPRGHGAP